MKNQYSATHRPLMPYQNQIGGQKNVKTIQGAKMLIHTKNWNLRWKDEDSKGFYESLRNKVKNYGILIENYSDITRDDNITAITEDKCEKMSNILFYVIHICKQQWIDNTSKLDLLPCYSSQHNGIGFVKYFLVYDTHLNLYSVL